MRLARSAAIFNNPWTARRSFRNPRSPRQTSPLAPMRQARPMPRPPLTRIAVLAIALLLCGGRTLVADGPAAKSWRAGVARRVVTPETPVWLAGYGTKRAPDGKLHDLWVKSLALEDGEGRRAVMITSDFQGVPKVMSDPGLRAAQAKSLAWNDNR